MECFFFIWHSFNSQIRLVLLKSIILCIWLSGASFVAEYWVVNLNKNESFYWNLFYIFTNMDGILCECNVHVQVHYCTSTINLDLNVSSDIWSLNTEMQILNLLKSYDHRINHNKGCGKYANTNGKDTFASNIHLFGQMTSSRWWIYDFIVKYGKVEGQSQPNWMSWLHFRFGNLKGFLISILWILNDGFERL